MLLSMPVVSSMIVLSISHGRLRHLHGMTPHDRRVFTTADVTFEETDIHIPNYSENMEIELVGLQDLTAEERQLVDAHADRDDEVDCEQRALSRIDETIPVRESTSSTSSTQASIAEAEVLEDTLNDSSTYTLLPKPSPCLTMMDLPTASVTFNYTSDSCVRQPEM